MNDPILKSHWERFKAHVVLDLPTVKKLIAPYTSASIETIQWLSEGCANTNYKISFTNQQPPVVLRIYTREQSALKREVALHSLLKDKVPVPAPLYKDDSCNIFEHPYTIMQWMDGFLMRDVILSGDKAAIYDCAFEAGRYLNQLRQDTFTEGGFFQEQLKIRPFDHSETYQPFVLGLLKDDVVQESLGDHLLQAVSTWVNHHLTYFPTEHNANLTHGDFDPANMLVKQNNGHWKITAILDWEFAFSGTYFLDMGMYLRYAHKLPSDYEQGFIAGIESNGFKLPSNWKLQAKLMDLLCLLHLLHYNPIESRPNLNHDVVALITHTIKTYHHN